MRPVVNNHGARIPEEKMKTKLDQWKVRELIEARNNNDLRVNAEYQRGAIWKESQMRLLIDSVFRGYQMPLIYLRKEERTVRGSVSTTYYDIIDGQQRINALRSFVAGAIIQESRSDEKAKRLFKPLFNPLDERDKTRFPIALQDTECAWGGKLFKDLDDDIKEEFLNREVSIAEMICDNDAEARDLFIRLQGGSDLKAQEKRDAWPGNVCQIVLEIGGKPQLVRYPGHDFFLKVMKASPESDRGKTRQLAAQVLMLFLGQKQKGRGHYVAIKTQMLNDFYRLHADLDLDSWEVKRFRSILDKLAVLFGGGKHPPLLGHDAIHLVLFTDMLMDYYTPKWEDGLVAAFSKFSAKLREARKEDDFPVRKSKDFQDLWTYGFRTRTNSDYPATIRQRHEIYTRLMLQYLGDNAVEKDPQRGFANWQRELIYYRDKKRCHQCGGEVVWDDAEIHHKVPHSEGGQTTLDNGVLMHRQCHQELHAKQNKGDE